MEERLGGWLGDPGFRWGYGVEVARLSFAACLVRARKQEGLSEEEAAERMGLTVGRLRRLENGEMNPRLDEMAGMLAMLGRFLRLDSPIMLHGPKEGGAA
jgi:transcriptional regulator with XRE-family HTH domain